MKGGFPRLAVCFRITYKAASFRNIFRLRRLSQWLELMDFQYRNPMERVRFMFLAFRKELCQGGLAA